MYNITILNKLGLSIYVYANINRCTDFRFSAYSHNSIFFEFLPALITKPAKPFFPKKNVCLYGKNNLPPAKYGKNNLPPAKYGKLSQSPAKYGKNNLPPAKYGKLNIKYILYYIILVLVIVN